MRKLLGEKDVEAILQRLDRLTQDEARTTAAHILEVVHGVVQNMNVVMDGEKIPLGLQSSVRTIFFSLGGKASFESVRKVLGMFRIATTS